MRLDGVPTTEHAAADELPRKIRFKSGSAELLVDSPGTRIVEDADEVRLEVSPMPSISAITSTVSGASLDDSQPDASWTSLVMMRQSSSWRGLPSNASGKVARCVSLRTLRELEELREPEPETPTRSALAEGEALDASPASACSQRSSLALPQVGPLETTATATASATVTTAAGTATAMASATATATAASASAPVIMSTRSSSWLQPAAETDRGVTPAPPADLASQRPSQGAAAHGPAPPGAPPRDACAEAAAGVLLRTCAACPRGGDDESSVEWL